MHKEGFRIGLRGPDGYLYSEHSCQELDDDSDKAVAVIAAIPESNFEICIKIGEDFEWHGASRLLIDIAYDEGKDVSRHQLWWIVRKFLVVEQEFSFTTLTTWADSHPGLNSTRLRRRRGAGPETETLPLRMPYAVVDLEELIASGPEEESMADLEKSCVSISFARGVSSKRSGDQVKKKESGEPPKYPCTRDKGNLEGFHIANSDWFEPLPDDKGTPRCFVFVNQDSQYVETLEVKGQELSLKPVKRLSIGQHIPRVRLSVDAPSGNGNAMKKRNISEVAQETSHADTQSTKVESLKEEGSQMIESSSESRHDDRQRSISTSQPAHQHHHNSAITGPDPGDKELVSATKLEPVPLVDLTAKPTRKTTFHVAFNEKSAESKERKRKKLRLQLEDVEARREELALKQKLLELDEDD